MNTFRQSGYTLLSLPRADVRPLSLLLKTAKGTVEKLNSPIKSLFEPVNSQPPAISKDLPMPSELSGEEKLDLKIESNFSFLKGLLKVFSGNAAVDFSLENKNSINFKLNDPKTNVIDIVKLDAFIQDAKVNTAARSILERLQNDELYIITEVIKAKSFTLNEDASSDLHAGAEVPLKKIVDAKTDVNIQKEKSRQIENKDGAYCTIAIKAFQVLYDKPSLFSSRPEGFRLREATDIKIFRGDETYPAIPLEDTIVELSDTPI